MLKKCEAADPVPDHRVAFLRTELGKVCGGDQVKKDGYEAGALSKRYGGHHEQFVYKPVISCKSSLTSVHGPSPHLGVRSGIWSRPAHGGRRWRLSAFRRNSSAHLPPAASENRSFGLWQLRLGAVPLRAKSINLVEHPLKEG
jgi:hypothetical protein